MKICALLGLILGLILGFVLLVGLGTWQMHRLQEKTTLLETVAQRCHGTPLFLTFPTTSKKYQRVVLEGVFLHKKTVYWWDTDGYHPITPFQLRSGGTVLVDRGAVSRTVPNSSPKPSGYIRLEGFLTPSAQRHWFDPPDDPQNNVWFVRDVSRLSKHINIPPLPWLVTASPTCPTWSNPHLGYALTWYGLAIVLVIMSSVWFWGRPKE